jgi:DNA-binding transcriptional LysR family regulator
MLDLAQVKSFVAVIEAGSFHGAARRLGLAQATVSQHVRKLEETLGVALVVRSRTRCTPSHKGSTFLSHARRLLQAAEDARSSVHHSRLKVGAASNLGIYLLPAFVRSFHQNFGETPRIELSIAANPTVAQRMLRGEIDLAVMEWWEPEPGFEATLWRSEPLVVIVPPGHPFAARDRIAVEDLIGEPLIGGEPGTRTGRLLRETLGPRVSSRLVIASELGSTEAVKHAVAAGLGISIVLAASVTEEVRAGSLCALSFQGVDLRKPLFVALPENTPERGWAAAFRDLLLANGAARSPCHPDVTERSYRNSQRVKDNDCELR